MSETQLVAKDKIEKSSFVTAPWYEMYLQDRRPLIVNSNPAVGWKEDPNRTTQLSRASSLLHAAIFNKSKAACLTSARLSSVTAYSINVF